MLARTVSATPEERFRDQFGYFAVDRVRILCFFSFRTIGSVHAPRTYPQRHSSNRSEEAFVPKILRHPQFRHPQHGEAAAIVSWHERGIAVESVSIPGIFIRKNLLQDFVLCLIEEWTSWVFSEIWLPVLHYLSYVLREA